MRLYGCQAALASGARVERQAGIATVAAAAVSPIGHAEASAVVPSGAMSHASPEVDNAKTVLPTTIGVSRPVRRRTVTSQLNAPRGSTAAARTIRGMVAWALYAWPKRRRS